MSFDKHSNFNKLANFSEVKFGENMPVLEVELNEMQQIQNEARADIVRDSIPSGFITLGEIDYDYCKNNNNQIKLKSESIAYVNGYRITIPKDTIIEIGESDVDKEREDLVFLEVWKEAVNDIDTLTEYGGENNSVINNPIKDSRYPVATTQRVALKYRIRHVADLDFNKTWSTGTSSIHPYIGWDNTNSFSNVYAIGGDETITKPTTVGAYKLFRCATYNDSSYPKYSDDSGLWVAGRNDEASFEYFKNASIDGYVYAIPMFRLKRRMNVGLCSPFEYKKIHNQLDQKKFAHLVGQENVEKVHSVNVKGETYVNLLTNAPTRTNNTLLNLEVTPSQISFDIGKSWGELGFLIYGKPNTEYIFNCSEIHEGVYVYVNFEDKLGSADLSLIVKGNKTRCTFTTDSTGVILFSFEAGSKTTGLYINNPVLMEMSDWNEELCGKTINGVCSLGSESNNSITVENNIIEEGTYVHELQNHILPTYPEVTHVTWGGDVVIPPEVEIELKNGEEVIQTITQLPVKLETTGEEKLHVKTMKGRTLVNLSPKRSYDFSCHGNDTDIYSVNSGVNEITLTINEYPNNWRYIYIPLTLNLLEPNTKYLVIFDGNFSGSFSIKCGNSSYPLEKESVHNSGKNSVVIETNNLSNGIKDQFLYLYPTAPDTFPHTYKVSNIRFIKYQDGMENWGLKYFEGMKSVEAPNIKVTGKNLFDVNLHSSITIREDGIYELNTSDWSRSDVPYLLKPNTTYTLSFHTDHSHCWTCIKINGNTTSLKINENYSKSFTTDSTGIVNLGVYANAKDNVGITFISIQLEENNFNTAHTPHKLHTFRTPKDIELRSLPNDIFDCLDLSSGLHTQRVGLLSFEGSSDDIWISNTDFDTESTKFLFTHNGILRSGIKKIHPSSSHYVLNDYFISANSDHRYVIKSKKIEGVLGGDGHDGMIQFFIRRDRLSSLNDIGFNQWISNNPVHVQYVLAQPTTKKIGLSENDYVGKSKVTYQLAEPLRKVGNYSDYIKGNTLYSNIGVEVLDGSEDWEEQNNTGNNHGFFLSHSNSMSSTPLISPQLPTLDGWEDYTRKGIFRGSGAIGLVVSADDLSENTLQGFKNWLRDNPVTIYYVKANPIEIPLKEVSPLECDFSLYRQFSKEYLGYPKELPNGVKDIVVSKNKIKRYTRHLIFNGSDESWTLVSNSSSGSVVRAFTNVSKDESSRLKALSEILNSYKFPFGTASDVYEQIGVDQNGNVVLSLAKSRLSSPDLNGFKDYLRRENLQVIVELNAPTMNNASEEICKHIPYMPLNSYVGSLYLTNGINQTKFLTDFSPSDYQVQTYHRYFSNEFNMFEDIKHKKSPYGHKTTPVSLTANLHDGELFTNTGFQLNEGVYETAMEWVASKNLIPVVEGKTYHITLTADDTDISSNRRYTYVYKYDSKGNYLKARYDLNTRTQFTADTTGYVLVVIKTKNVSHIQVTEDKAYTEKIPYIRGEKFIAGLEKHEIEDLRHKVSLTGFDYSQLLQDSFLKLIKGELS